MQHMSPADWALRPFKKYATFSGRAPRAEYWWFYLATFVVSLVLDLVERALGGPGALSILFSLAILVPWLAVTVRRLHDINRSGWWLMAFVASGLTLLLFVVMAGLETTEPEPMTAPLVVSAIAFMAAAIALFVCTVLPGTDGPNDYGPDPYAVSDLEEVFA